MIPNCSLNNAKNLKLLLYLYSLYRGCNPATYTGLILSHYKDPIMNQPGKWHAARVLVMAHMDLPRWNFPLSTCSSCTSWRPHEVGERLPVKGNQWFGTDAKYWFCSRWLVQILISKWAGMARCPCLNAVLGFLYQGLLFLCTYVP